MGLLEGSGSDGVKKSIKIIILSVFFLNVAAFLYTFVQPHWTAAIVKVGWPRSVENTGMRRHGSGTHTVIPLTVTYTDENGTKQTANINYSRPTQTFSVGQEIEITRSYVTGLIPYPFSGLRLFSGIVAGGIGLFLFFMWIDRKKTP